PKPMLVPPVQIRTVAVPILKPQPLPPPRPLAGPPERRRARDVPVPPGFDRGRLAQRPDPALARRAPSAHRHREPPGRRPQIVLPLPIPAFHINPSPPPHIIPHPIT